MPQRETEDMQEPKTRGGRKPIILDSFNQSLLRMEEWYAPVLNFYCRGEIPNLEKYIERFKTQMSFQKWESKL